jgi:para-aminobenzoate synthetase/4-amino-4-deoxychorismate lyase
MGVGSGIVIDSNPADEFRECLLKAEFLTRPANSPTHPSPNSFSFPFSLVETLLWHGEYPLIELHLDRLEDSAHYFAFPFNRAETKTALLAHAREFTSGPPWTLGAPSLRLSSRARVGDHELQPVGGSRKIRLLVSTDGSLHITSEQLPIPSIEPLKVRIASHRIDPNDPMYFHKTTHRPLYAQAFQAATKCGYDDVLFLNLRGEVTEGAIHNIFIEKDGRLLTPPVDCGLLPGVHRRHILESNPNAQESVLKIEDLRQADAVYLSNAVRGLRQAIIDWEAG